MISSNLVGCSTGWSAGLAPVEIFPTKVPTRHYTSVVDAVADQASADCIGTPCVDRRRHLLRGQRDEPVSAAEEERVASDDRAARLCTRQCRESGVEILLAAGIQHYQPAAPWPV